MSSRCRRRVINVTLTIIEPIPVFNKVFEKLAYKQLYDYLENNSILHKQRLGAKKNAIHDILQFLQYLYNHIDSRDVLFSLFLDFH